MKPLLFAGYVILFAGLAIYIIGCIIVLFNQPPE